MQIVKIQFNFTGKNSNSSFWKKKTILGEWINGFWKVYPVEVFVRYGPTYWNRLKLYWNNGLTEPFHITIIVMLSQTMTKTIEYSLKECFNKIKFKRKMPKDDTSITIINVCTIEVVHKWRHEHAQLSLVTVTAKPFNLLSSNIIYGWPLRVQKMI